MSPRYSFAANLTPTYWSASQLLAEHEHRTGTLPRKSSKNGGYADGGSVYGKSTGGSTAYGGGVFDGGSVYAAGGEPYIGDNIYGSTYNDGSVYNGYTITPLNNKKQPGLSQEWLVT